MGKGGKYLSIPGKKPGGKRKKTVRTVLYVLVILLLIVLIAGIVIYKATLDKIQRTEVEEKEFTMSEELQQMMGVTETGVPTETVAPVTTAATTVPAGPVEPDALNVLIVGQAARDGEAYHMADTMILVTVNKNTKVVTLTSFWRDTFVDLPDYMGHTCEWNRINVCYHLGWTFGGTGAAMDMTNLCLKNNFGIEVDYNVEIDFNAFVKIVDILGGVRMPLTDAELQYLEKEGFTDLPAGNEEGEYRLFGYEALAYGRMRKATGDGDSDLVRTARQRDLMDAIIQKLVRKGPAKVKELAEEVLPMITTNMTNAQITECLVELLPLLPEITIEKGTCPVEGTYYGEIIDLFGTPSSVLKFDAAKNKSIMIPLTEGYLPEETEPAA